MSLFQQASIKPRVLALWESVFSASNKILTDAHVYGFSHMGIIPDPNIHQIRSTLKIVEMMLNEIVDSYLSELDHDQARMVINAREQLRRMERLAIALQTDDEVEYDKAVTELERQTVI